MKFSTLFLISILIAFSYSSLKVGKWERDSFEKNSLYIDGARKKGESEIRSRFSFDEDYVIAYPVEIYKQIVNGFNYKIVYAFYDTNSNEVGIFNSVVYTGPLSSTKIKFDIVNTAQIESNDALSNGGELLERVKEVIDEFTEVANEKLIITGCYPDAALEGTSAYVVKASGVYYVIFEDEAGKMKVDALIYTAN